MRFQNNFEARKDYVAAAWLHGLAVKPSSKHFTQDTGLTCKAMK